MHSSRSRRRRRRIRKDVPCIRRRKGQRDSAIANIHTGRRTQFCPYLDFWGLRERPLWPLELFSWVFIFMCQMDSKMDQQMFLIPAKPSPIRDDAFVSCAPSKAEKSPSAGECGKKKRVQRAAKLKQCKMDARREQWLAQVSGKAIKPDSCASSHSSSQDDRDEKEILLQSSTGDVDSGSLVDKEELEESQCKPSIGSMPTDELSCSWHGDRFCKQRECLADGNKHGFLCHQQINGKPLDHREGEQKTVNTRRLTRAGIWSSSDTSSTHSNSSQVNSSSDDENEVEDWEAVADALQMQATVEVAKPVMSADHYLMMNRQTDSKSSSSSDMSKCILKPESKYRPGNVGSRTRADSGRAWRPDDVSRPPTLPCLSKQHSFPLQSGTCLWATPRTDMWGLPPPPSHCPICTEELDTTDTSFVPCFCGFRLCLFCHNRILVGDGRCPGCRKSYNSEAALKLSRTWSARPRV